MERKKDGAPFNPRPAPGRRNIWCPHYQHCLDQAAWRDWRSFSCDHCPFKSQGQPHARDWEACLELIKAVLATPSR